MRVLIAEDEVELAKALKFLLEKNKFTVDMVHDGAEALARIRKSGAAVPVLMLTAKAEIEDRVAGLEAGADDYLPKPFASREFIARVKALSRRNGGYSETILSFGDVELDCNRYTLGCGSLSVRLNNKEFQLAELFFRHPHYVFSTNHLMDRIWGQDSEAGIDVVWTYIGFVRRKLREIACSVEIRTVRGAGYSLEESV
ncbi:response regulator transcription factor [Acetatifactor aquisgranensis]|uniref:response regulator transcription factor n=1 Tax=Acetatifactor aquisgranensis TaxID=2941233 RepID=UPI00203E375C|nr:response regulator transcription factor [Acetatifactor aquisgranensis]